MPTDPPATDGNPFSTRYVRPGAVGFLFPASGGGEVFESASQVVERLARLRWVGQIVGPHGSGKSTLLHALRPALEKVGRRVAWFALHQGEHRLSIAATDWERWDTSCQIVVDGFEQLGWWRRHRLISNCRRHGCGLLVTTHKDLGLPTLVEQTTSLATALAVVEKLLVGDWQLITRADVEAEFGRRGKNLRETLFGLYDLYEKRRREKL